jgi:hypothetical protein
MYKPLTPVLGLVVVARLVGNALAVGVRVDGVRIAALAAAGAGAVDHLLNEGKWETIWKLWRIWKL